MNKVALSHALVKSCGFCTFMCLVTSRPRDAFEYSTNYLPSYLKTHDAFEYAVICNELLCDINNCNTSMICNKLSKYLCLDDVFMSCRIGAFLWSSFSSRD